jgi:hypothetical protein
MDPKHPYPNVHHVHPVLVLDSDTKGTKDPNSPVDQLDETHVHGVVDDALLVTGYRLYKRRWIGLGTLPGTHKTFHSR